jgi:hypothetical protein
VSDVRMFGRVRNEATKEGMNIIQQPSAVRDLLGRSIHPLTHGSPP